MQAVWVLLIGFGALRGACEFLPVGETGAADEGRPSCGAGARAPSIRMIERKKRASGQHELDVTTKANEAKLI